MATLKRGRIEVNIKWIGEGHCGDYNPEAPNDEKLLRFYVSKDGEDVDDASYCTTIPEDIGETRMLVFARMIMDEVYDYAICEMSIKRICERLSWTCPNMIGGQYVALRQVR